MSENRMEIIWGTRLLDEGFTSIPNILIRNYRKLKIEHGEYGFISQLLSYKHDARDPYPSRELLAENLCCSTRQIDKWVKSLRTKGLLRTGRRRNVHNKQWDNAVYSFKPLLDSLLRLIGEQELPAPAEEFEVIWDDETDKNEPRVPEVRMGSVPEVRMGLVPEVRTKRKSKKENIKDDCLIEASAEIAAARSEISVSLESDLEIGEPDAIYEALQEHVPANCYINSVPLTGGYIDEIYLMLQQPKFKNRLDPEVVRIACEIYFDHACRIEAPYGVVMKMNVKEPVAYFSWCYESAIKQYKAMRSSKNKSRKDSAAWKK